ncbi:MAG: Trp biosynthesis-associated membrane protein [Sporichthyaceae bacterium]
MTTTRRDPLIALLLLLAGVGTSTFAASRDWADGQAVQGELRVPLEVSGGALAPAVPTLALAALAALLVLVAAGGLLRRISGALIAVCGLGAAAVAARNAQPGDSALTEAAGEAIGTGTAMAQAEPTGWGWVAVIGGLMIAGAGLLALVRGGGWPGMSARYEAPSATPSGADAAAVRERTPAPDTALETWRALDRGEDPTAAP